MVNLTKFKELLLMGENKESRSKSLKPPDISFNSQGFRSASIYIRLDYYYFTGGGEWDKGGETPWYPFFKIPIDASAKEKGKAVCKALSGYKVGISYAEFSTVDIQERERALRTIRT